MEKKKMKWHQYLILMMVVCFALTGFLPMVAKAEGETWIVAFDANGANCDVSEIKVPKGESITLPEITREGYRFDGWIYAYEKEGGVEVHENLGYAGGTFTPWEFYSFVYAGWKEEFSLTFDACGGECAQESMLVTELESVTLPEAVRGGYEFTGWYGDGACTEFVGAAGDSYSTREDKILYAGWKEQEKEKQKFTIIFDAGEGKCNPESVEVEEGESISLPEAIREGYEFTGWYGDERCTEYIGTAGNIYVPEGGTTLYAGWKEQEKEKQKFVIIFNAGEGKCDPKSVEVEEGERVSLPEAIREGYKFTGWYGNEDLTEYIGAAGDTFEPEEERTLYAGWREQEKEKQKFTVIFDVGEGECNLKSVEVEEGEDVSLPEAIREGFEFTGWYRDEGCTEYIGPAGDIYAPTEGTTLYAGWKEQEKEKHKFTVIFNAGEGECNLERVEIEEGESVSLPEATRKGYDFTGWYGNEDLTEYIGAAGDTFEPEEERTLYAGWREQEKEKQKFTVIFDAGEGECNPKSVEVEEGEKVSLPKATREGFDFTGWYGDEGCTDYIGTVGDTYVPEEEKILYAGWKEQEKEKQKFTVIFDAGEGECNPKSVEVEEGEKVSLPEAIREGFEFTGWYGDKGCTDYIGTVGDTYVPEKEATLYAGWKEQEKEKRKVTIIFDAGEGECNPKSVEVEEGESVSLPDAVREGYDFTGWYGNEDLTEYIGAVGDAYEPEEETTLYAGWKEQEKEKQKFTIIFSAGEGECNPKRVEVEEGESVSLPEAVREGYDFTGWYGNEDLTEYIGAAGDTFEPEEEKTLYAEWKEQKKEKQKFTVIFNAGEGECNPKSVEVEEGEKVSLPKATREGFEFTGWYGDKGLTEYIGAAGDMIAPKKAEILYAGWKVEEITGGEEKEPGEDKEQKFTVTFISGTGTKIEPIKVAKGGTIKLPSIERKGAILKGWYTQKDGGTFLGIPGDSLKVVKDITAYALWEKKEESKEDQEDGKTDDQDADQEEEKQETCNACFHTGRGNLTVTEASVVKGASLYLPLPECDGYEFAGWYLDQGLTRFAGNSGETYQITENICFYAKWKKIEEHKKTDKTPEKETEKGDRGQGKTEINKESTSAGEQTFSGNTSDGSGTGTKAETGSRLGMEENVLSAGDTYKEREEGDSTDTGKALEPVIQTGHLSLVPVFYCIGLCGVVLCFSALLWKRKNWHKKG